MTDKRYEETEREFLASYLKAKKRKPYSICIRITDILKIAKRSESTFHRHYRSVDEIVTKREKKALKEYRQTLQRFRKKSPTVRQIIQNALLFIRENQDFFKVVFLQNNQDFFESFMGELKLFIKKNWFDNNSKIYHLCVGEIYLILKNWGETNFDIDKLEKTLSDIVYLIESARPRLSAVQHN